MCGRRRGNRCGGGPQGPGYGGYGNGYGNGGYPPPPPSQWSGGCGCHCFAPPPPPPSYPGPCYRPPSVGGALEWWQTYHPPSPPPPYYPPPAGGCLGGGYGYAYHWSVCPPNCGHHQQGGNPPNSPQGGTFTPKIIEPEQCGDKKPGYQIVVLRPRK